MGITGVQLSAAAERQVDHFAFLLSLQFQSPETAGQRVVILTSISIITTEPVSVQSNRIFGVYKQDCMTSPKPREYMQVKVKVS